MLNIFKKIFLISAYTLLIICPAICFAWGDYSAYGGNDWDYHGSGRDKPYSSVIDEYYNPGYVYYYKHEPDYSDIAFQQIPQQARTASNIQPGDFIVNIPNSHGGFNAVVIKRSGYGFRGPNGEYYPEFPKIFQLEILYGK